MLLDELNPFLHDLTRHEYAFCLYEGRGSSVRGLLLVFRGEVGSDWVREEMEDVIEEAISSARRSM